jgi:hypothetical protein
MFTWDFLLSLLHWFFSRLLAFLFIFLELVLFFVEFWLVFLLEEKNLFSVNGCLIGQLTPHIDVFLQAFLLLLLPLFLLLLLLLFLVLRL